MLILRETKGGKPFRVRNVALVGTHITFGRSPLSTYTLENMRSVSRVQATLKRDTDGWWLTDGAVDKPSGAGIYLGTQRLSRPTLIDADMTFELFRSADYVAILEVVDISEEELIQSEKDTLEIPIPNNYGEIAALQTSIAALAKRVEEVVARVDTVAQQVNHCEQNTQNQIEGLVAAMKCDLSQSISDELIGKIDSLAAALSPQIEAAHVKNSEQDIMISRVLTGTAAALISIGAYNFSQGKTDAVDRALSILQMFIGGGAGTAVMMRKSTKSSSPEFNGGPEWSR